MNGAFFYLFKASAFIIIFYIFHWIALKHTTFHRLNRFFLLSGLCLSFLLPFVSWPNQALFHANGIYDLIINFDGFFISDEGSMMIELNNSIDFSYLKIIAVVIYSTISLSLIYRLLKNIYSIRFLKISAQSIKQDGIRFFSGTGIKQPFTFFRWIFIPYSLNEKTFELSILRHEKAHASQWHTIDLLIIEIIIVFLWFNPFVFLFKLTIRQIHEYLADEEATRNCVVKADYLKLLVSNSSLSDLSGITSQFYWLTLKKRVQMITKDKSPDKLKLRYFLIIPILVLSTMTFSGFNFYQDIGLDKNTDTPSISPIKEGKYNISSEWGMREHPITKKMKMHSGIDLKAETGTEVLATADGTVVKLDFSGEGKGYGRLILIQHDNIYSSVYAQLSAFNVQIGDKVNQGDVIGYVGSSGLSTGPHLHYEVIENGKRVNPVNFFN
jgi:hypothetical protein